LHFTDPSGYLAYGSGGYDYSHITQANNHAQWDSYNWRLQLSAYVQNDIKGNYTGSGSAPAGILTMMINHFVTGGDGGNPYADNLVSSVTANAINVAFANTAFANMRLGKKIHRSYKLLMETIPGNNEWYTYDGWETGYQTVSLANWMEKFIKSAANSGEMWYYGVDVGGLDHSLVRTSDAIIYEINHPQNGRIDGGTSSRNGGPKAVGYKYD
jgi:hypothetical protein